jgi:RHS repeat-associated protein
MEVKQSGNTILTRWYPGGSYIKETAGGATKEYTFIGGDAYSAPVVSITQSGTTTYYNLLRDHIGSITHVVNASNNTLLYEYSYDPWGRMRNVTSWTNYAPGSEPSLFVAARGFTGHEHLPWFNLINMNGRIYDPLVGQFLSPDNHVQAPYFTQSLNRYVYCVNNPLRFTDPSGERTILGRFFNWIGEQGAKPWIRALVSLPTMLSVAPGEVLTMDAMSGGGFVTNYIQGGFSKGFQGVGNYFTINGQMFDTGTETKGWGRRLLSRFTYEGLNTLIGNTAATLINSSGLVNDIQYYRGATVLRTRGDYGAITFGNFIIGDMDIEALPDNYVFQHEYGHYLRSRESGPGYIIEYGIPSLLYTAGHSAEESMYYWTELDANKTAFFYFEEQYPGLQYWKYISNPLFEKDDPRNRSYPVFLYEHRDTPSVYSLEGH